MLEFYDITVKFICDRGVSHELVRHRTGNYAQESQRYCNYSKHKFDGELTVIDPPFFTADTLEEVKKYNAWCSACEYAETKYFELLKLGATPQEARTVLPNSTKTEINVKNDLRNWRHFFKLRTAKASHPQMRELTIPLLKELQSKIPVIFDDITVEG
jgi:thymidylate synthase (FAD)